MMIKKFLSLLLTVIMVLSVISLTGLMSFATDGDEGTSGDFEYLVISETDKTCEIKKYTGSNENLNIPSTLNGYSVTTIDEQAFRRCTSLESIVIPDGVTTVEMHAFTGCTSLENITIPDSVKYIGVWAFHNTAYYNNESNWENGVLYIDKHLIEAKKEVVSSKNAIKRGTVSIAECAFEGCTSLKSITIPNSITSISSSAFKDCTSLENITITDSVKDIGVWAFYNTAYYNNESNWENGVLYIGNHLIKANGDIVFGEYTIKDGTVNIAYAAFQGCSALTSIIIPDSVTDIGPGTFVGCAALENVTLSNSQKSISTGTFFRCTSLKSIIIPDSVTAIEASAFLDCTSLESVTIPESVISIGEYAFSSIGENETFNNLSLTIYGYAGSYAETYAKNNQIPFSAIKRIESVNDVTDNVNSNEKDKKKESEDDSNVTIIIIVVAIATVLAIAAVTGVAIFKHKKKSTENNTVK